VTTPTYTPNMNLGLPVPGVTGALGVELPGYSWMELQNAAFTALDSHDHSAGKGVPVSSLGINVVADFAFNGFAPLNVRGLGLSSLGSAPADVGFIYRSGVDLYYKNGSGGVVQITSGTGVAGAPGNITGFPSGTASLVFTPGAGSFTFNQATNQRGPLLGGPLSIADPVASGKAVLISAPSGLAADYSLTLPSALPAALSILTLSAAGAIVASGNITDNSSLQQTAGVLSIKASGVTATKIADANVTTVKVADLNVTKPKLAVNAKALSGGTGASAYQTGTANTTVVTCGAITAQGDRSVLVEFHPTGAAGSLFSATNPTTTDTVVFRFKVGTQLLAAFRMVIDTVGATVSWPSLSFRDGTVGGGSRVYSLECQAGDPSTTVSYFSMQMTVEEI
jgi:hypothetical protein